jgi:hypothetical protein
MSPAARKFTVMLFESDTRKLILSVLTPLPINPVTINPKTNFVYTDSSISFSLVFLEVH